MRVLYSFFILALFLTVTVPTAQAAPSHMDGPVTAKVIDVIDGDTVRVRVTVWLGQSLETLVRIKGIDTPEKRSQCDHEKQQADKARQRLSSLIGDRNIILYDIHAGKYAGRVLAAVRTLDGQDIAENMLAAGLARPYHGKKRHSWCS